MSFFQKLAKAFTGPTDTIPALSDKDQKVLDDINTSFENYGTTLPPADFSPEK